jgi:hypothetical protein
MAQTSIQVKSSENLLPLPYATVLNITKGVMLFSDENGIVSGSFEVGDSISISYIGFNSIKDRIHKPGALTYLMRQTEIVLNPVKVSGCKPEVKFKYSNLESGVHDRKFGGVCCWHKGQTTAKAAIMLKPDVDHFRLSSFSIWLKRGFNAPKLAIQTPMLFSFYTINEATMLPGELISNRQVIYYPKKEGRQIINVDSLDLRIYRPGMYVCIEFVYSEKYEWPMRYVDSLKNIDTTFIQYGSRIDGIFSKDFSLAFYNYVTNNWSFAGKREKPELQNVHSTIRFSAEILLCKKDKK